MRSNGSFNVKDVKRQEENANRKNMKLIKEFLKERKKQQTAHASELSKLGQLRKNGSIDENIYERMLKLVLSTCEKERIQLLDALVRNSAKNGLSKVIRSTSQKALAEAFNNQQKINQKLP